MFTVAGRHTVSRENVYYIYILFKAVARPTTLYQNYFLTVFVSLFYGIFVKRDIFIVTANSSTDLARTGIHIHIHICTYVYRDAPDALS